MSSRKVDIVIAGVQKAATTSLKNYLGQHPAIITHDAPEFGFFSIDSEFEKGFDSCFDQTFPSCENQKILIKNVDIIFWEECIARIKNHNQQSKIIVLLRNPVERAYSAYWFARRRGWESISSFEEAIDASPQRFTDKLGISNVSYLEKGNYAKQLNTLYKYFTCEQTMVILQEDLRNNPLSVFAGLFNFLEIDSSFLPETTVEHNISARARIPSLARFAVHDNAVKTSLRKIIPGRYLRKLRNTFTALNEEKFVPPSIAPETKNKLIEYYRPLNSELESILERNLSHWNL